MYLYKYVDKKGYNRHYDISSFEKKTYKVVKETPMGYWISEVFQSGNFEVISYDKKWISKNTNHHKKFAFQNDVDAIRNYRFKKASQIRILTERLIDAEERYKAAIEKDVTYRPRDEEYFSRLMVNGKKIHKNKPSTAPRFRNKGGFITEKEMLI